MKEYHFKSTFLILLFLFLSIHSIHSQTCVPNSKWKVPATNAVSTFLSHFSAPSNSLFPLFSTFPHSSQHAGYWVYALSFDAVTSASSALSSNFSPSISTLFSGVQNHWVDDFYDDMNWMTLALLNAHNHTRNQQYLSTAVSLFQNIINAWDDSCCGPHHGGNWWDKRHTQKATASNAGPVISALQLYRATNNKMYLDYAQKVYHFWRNYQVNNSTGQVVDHLNVPSGQQVWWSFTYNQGLMIGAALEMYLAHNRNVQFLADANLVARFMIKNEVVGNGVLHDCGNPPGSDCPNFKGIGYKYLAQLERLEGKGEYRGVLRASVESLWNKARGSDGLFNWDWMGPAPSGAVSASQENAAMLALIWACTLE